MNDILTIIIPSYNSAATITHTLNSIISQRDYQAQIDEIIIVDSSDDGKTIDIISAYQGKSIPVRIVSAPTKTLPARARNIGADCARGNILVFLDADVNLCDDWIKTMVDAYQSGCKIAGSAISLTEAQESIKTAIAQYYLQLNEFMPYGGRRTKEFLPSCNLICSRGIFMQVGGFPIVRASEDVLFGLKASKMTNVWFIPDVTVAHTFREGLRSLVKNQFLLGRYNLIYRKQFYSGAIYKGILPIIFLPLFLIIKLKRMTSRILASGTANIRTWLMTIHLFMIGIISWSAGFTLGTVQSLRK